MAEVSHEDKIAITIRSDEQREGRLVADKMIVGRNAQ